MEFHFSRTYANWVIHNYDHLNITEVYAKGKDLEDLLANAEIYIQTWHGGEGPQWSVGDLPQKDYDALVLELTEFLASQDEGRADV